MCFLRAARADDVFRARAFSAPGPLRSTPRGEMYGFTEAPARFPQIVREGPKPVFGDFCIFPFSSPGRPGCPEEV